ncbi:MAG: TldD/PmbA family protein [Myxococcota bacterium]|nr:TldD/PmbA family protein [Myxococcota bacterium]
MGHTIEDIFRSLTNQADAISLRYIREETESLSIREGKFESAPMHLNEGLMITVEHQGGVGYAATSNLSKFGIEKAITQAKTWALATAENSLGGLTEPVQRAPMGQYQTPIEKSWSDLTFVNKLEYLQEASSQLSLDIKIVDWFAKITEIKTHQLFLTSHGGRVEQSFNFILPSLGVVANDGQKSQRRTFVDHCQQGGLDVLEKMQFRTLGLGLAEEALELLAAPQCPSGKHDLLLMPDQMMLQIHESIGHPLELDRILGDERNYAGTSFVDLDMFGSYQYGSELLNISFDPHKNRELASYAFDDEGTKAEKILIIENGILKAPLGGKTSQRRANIAGTSTTRACSWNRPAIDRMANLNLEPGDSSFDEMIRKTEQGILMQTNSSWSIDDSRNKFQFGCEYGRLINNGELGQVVKTPGYRGISATFWRNLKAVGSASTARTLGTPNCGKGEPNQVIRVGHASPSCLFSNIDCFGGES